MASEPNLAQLLAFLRAVLGVYNRAGISAFGMAVLGRAFVGTALSTKNVKIIIGQLMLIYVTSEKCTHMIQKMLKLKLFFFSTSRTLIQRGLQPEACLFSKSTKVLF